MCHLLMSNIRSQFVMVDHLEIQKGELLVLIGPSGAGKFSLLNMLAGFLPHTGDILLDNRPIQHLPPHQRQIGYLFQDLYLFPHMTVYQNLKIALQALKRIFFQDRRPSPLWFRFRHLSDADLKQIQHKMAMDVSTFAV